MIALKISEVLKVVEHLIQFFDSKAIYQNGNLSVLLLLPREIVHHNSYARSNNEDKSGSIIKWDTMHDHNYMNRATSALRWYCLSLQLCWELILVNKVQAIGFCLGVQYLMKP